MDWVFCFIKMPAGMVVVVHACNPSTWEAEVGNLKLDTAMRYTARPLSYTIKMLPGGLVVRIQCSQTNR